MTPKERAAMQAAWVWMDWYSSNNGTLEPVDFNETITALREALKPNRKGKYYYKDNACTAANADSPDCICWHDEALAEQTEQSQLADATLEPAALSYALQLAEEALFSYEDITTKQCDEAIAAIRTVKESLTIEPVCFGCLYQGGRLEIFKTREMAQKYVNGSLRNGADVKLIELYAAPLAKQVTPVTQAVRTKYLTDDEIEEIGKSYFDEWSFGFARAVIQAFKEKNK